jgi:hypothetical protein
MPTLTIRRDKGWADKIRRYHIYLDNVAIGQIGEGEEISQQISAGRHVVDARVDWCRSQSLHFEAQSEDTVVLVQSNLRRWRIFFTLFYVLFNRENYLTLELT